MRKPRVFVSHSTPLDDEIRKGFVDEVCQALRDKGYDPLVDYKELQPGDWWRQRLNLGLADCHAAVILLSRRAVTDRPWWVRHEASVLTWRKSLDASFNLLPVRLDGVTLDDLSKSEFAPLHLTELQGFQPQTAQEVADKLGDPPVRLPLTPLEQWVVHLAQLIEQGCRRQDEDDLLELAEAMGIDPLPPRNPTSRSGQLAKAIARQLACSGPPLFYEHLDGLTQALKAKDAAELLSAIAPAWIPHGAAAQLSTLSGGSAVINGNEVPTFTGPLYLQRAFWHTKKWIFFHSGVPVDQHQLVDRLAQSILENVRNHKKVRGRIRSAPERFLVETELSVFIVLHVHVGARDLAQLQQRFPKATFILSGGATLDEEAWKDYSQLKLILPPLDPDVESEALKAYDDCKSALEEEE